MSEIRRSLCMNLSCQQAPHLVQLLPSTPTPTPLHRLDKYTWQDFDTHSNKK